LIDRNLKWLKNLSERLARIEHNVAKSQVRERKKEREREREIDRERNVQKK